MVSEIKQKKIRAISVAVALTLTMLFAMIVYATSVSGTVSLNAQGLENLEVIYSGERADGHYQNGTVSVNPGSNGNSFTVTAKSGIHWTSRPSSTVKISMKNKTNLPYKLSFNYSCSSSNGTVQGLNGTSGSIKEQIVDGGGEISITVQSKENLDGAKTGISLTLSNITFEKYVVELTTVFWPTSHGSYTVDGTKIEKETPLTKGSDETYSLVAIPDEGYIFGSLFPGQGEKGGGNEVQFLKAIVGDVCLLIALGYQFFASSTSSCRGTSKPQTSCTFCRYSAYSPEVSMVLSRFSAPMTL